MAHTRTGPAKNGRTCYEHWTFPEAAGSEQETGIGIFRVEPILSEENTERPSRRDPSDPQRTPRRSRRGNFDTGVFPRAEEGDPPAAVNDEAVVATASLGKTSASRRASLSTKAWAVAWGADSFHFL